MGPEEAQVSEQEETTEVERLLKFHVAFCHQAYMLCQAKNHDYAGSDGSNPWRNFESTELLGIASTEIGLLIRMTDKLNRMVTFVKDGKLQCENEGAMDALIDMINYRVLLAGYMQKKANDG